MPAQGRGPEGHRRAPPTFLEGEKGPRPVAVSVKTDGLTPWLPTAASHSHTATKTFPARKATSEFSLPASVPLPRQDRVCSKQQEIGAPEVHTPASTFSTPWPGQRAQGRCPAPGLPAPSQGQASRDAAQPTHHGDSRRGRASAGSRCLGTGVGTQSPGRTSKVGSLRQKNKLQTPKNSQEPMETQIGLHPGGIRDAR